MKIIGLTGGIGAGKSTVSKVFENLGVPVFYSDYEAKKIMNNSLEVILKIKEKFGDNIYTSNNLLDKKKLASIIFNNKDKLDEINLIVHKAVNDYFTLWANNQNYVYVIKETAILFESGSSEMVNSIITVTAPENVRIERVIRRDNISYDEVKLRISNQLPEEEKVLLSDFIIENDDKSMVLPQVLKINNLLLST